MAPKEIGQAGSSAASSQHGQRRRLHVKPTIHVEAMARLNAARAEAKKVLKDVRARQKQEAKKHRRLMAKACKLSVTELKQIAEMKQTLLGGKLWRLPDLPAAPPLDRARRPPQPSHLGRVHHRKTMMMRTCEEPQPCPAFF